MTLSDIFKTLEFPVVSQPTEEVKPAEVIIPAGDYKEPETKTESQLIQEHMNVIERDFNGFSNIPIEHDYWKLRRHLDELNQKD